MAMRLGQMNAHVIRLDALGKRLTEMANIDHREFDFDSAPPTGGPETEGVSAQIPDLTNMLDSLERKVDLRDAQLAALENVILARDLKEADPPRWPPGARRASFPPTSASARTPSPGTRPSTRASISPAPRVRDVVAVAAGVVTWAGERAGYGSLVEISHGNGYVTRYGHNQRTLVAVGQTVTRGEPIALMGSTGPLHRPARALRSAAQRPPGQSAPRSSATRPDCPSRSGACLSAGERSCGRDPVPTSRIERAANQFRRSASIAYNTAPPSRDCRNCSPWLGFSSLGISVLQFLTRLLGSRNDRLVRAFGRAVRARPSAFEAADPGAERRGAAGQDRRVPPAPEGGRDPRPTCFPKPSPWCARPRRRTLKMRHFDVQLDRRHRRCTRAGSPRCAPAKARRWSPRCPRT